MRSSINLEKERTVSYGRRWINSRITVALKKCFDAFRNATDAQRTYREIQYLKHLRGHDNIVKLLDVHQAGKRQRYLRTFDYGNGSADKRIVLVSLRIFTSSTLFISSFGHSSIFIPRSYFIGISSRATFFSTATATSKCAILDSAGRFLTIWDPTRY